MKDIFKDNDDARLRVMRKIQFLVVVLAAALAAYIAVETFMQQPFLQDSGYMTFQFWVCVLFVCAFAAEATVAPRHWHYVRTHLFFLFISIPWLNIIARMGTEVPATALDYLRYMPLLRGAYAMYLIIKFAANSRIIGLFWTYLTVMLLMLVFASLLFYQREMPVNPDVKSFWTSLWWSSLELTTIGAPIYPVTPTGKVLAAILSGMGMIMFPLFTVYLSDLVKRSMRRFSGQNVKNQNQ